VQELLDFIQMQPAWYDRLLDSEEIKRKLSEQADNSNIDISEAVSERMKERLMAGLQDDGANVAELPGQASYHERKPLFRVLTGHWRWMAAAAIVITIGTIIFISIDRQPKGPEPVVVAKSTVNDVLPGGNKATLRLANGQVIMLDSTGNGSLATQGNTKIVKLADGQIAYTIEGKAATEVMYNTMSTPPGGQFRLKLPDGTDVWLNAASSITYPAAFVGKDRTVTITGEAYFEVAKNPSKPFHVKVNDMDVEVFGTHFNVNAYKDEAAIKTTLLEGKVKVGQSAIGPALKREQSAILKPGEQAILTANSPLTIDHSPDLDQVMAWKNGLFNFNKVSLQDVMKQIARWYDVEIVYQGEIKPKKFGGEIQRDLNLSEVLEGLKETGIHFRIEGKKLIVLP
jgi:ferric-dicitrate binding protein FerR (iron transport regulator)